MKSKEEMVVLINKVYDAVDRRQNEYLRVADLDTTNAEQKVSFIARAAECLGFLSDLDMLFDNLD